MSAEEGAGGGGGPDAPAAAAAAQAGVPGAPDAAGAADAADAAPPGEVPILGLDGSPAGGRTAALPDAFASPLRRDLVHKAYTILDSHRYQPKGVHPTAGMDNSADSFDPPTGRGRSRVARIKGSGAGGRGGEGAEVASTRGGRQAHPPRSNKRIHKRINRGERRLALRSAIAATAVRSVVEGRGHRVPAGRSLPIVVSGELERIARASELAGVIGALGLRDDVGRLVRRRARSGRSALRGRSKKAGKSILFVVGGGENGGSAPGGAGRPAPPAPDAGPAPPAAPDAGSPASPDAGPAPPAPDAGPAPPAPQGAPPPPPILRAAGSIPGVDVVRAGDLSVLDLAPGSEQGRLVVYTPGALDVIGKTASADLPGRMRERRLQARRRRHTSSRSGGGGGGGAEAAAASGGGDAGPASGQRPGPAPSASASPAEAAEREAGAQ